MSKTSRRRAENSNAPEISKLLRLVEDDPAAVRSFQTGTARCCCATSRFLGREEAAFHKSPKQGGHLACRVGEGDELLALARSPGRQDARPTFAQKKFLSF